MPVIRGTSTATVLGREDREALTAQLSKELTGDATDEGPIIFEIPLTGTDKIDVYFAEKQARGFTFMSRRLFVASFLEVVERVDEGLEVSV